MAIESPTAGHFAVSDVPAFVEAVERSNLLTLAERPFDLRALIDKWSADLALCSRLEVLQRLIDLQLAPLSARATPLRIAPDRARAAVQVLAGAVMLTGKSIIGLPDGAHTPDRIDPRVLLPDWSDAELDTPVRTGVFDDIVYASVRFRHREIRELLSRAPLLPRKLRRSRHLQGYRSNDTSIPTYGFMVVSR